jgi:hypothetical protein
MRILFGKVQVEFQSQESHPKSSQKSGLRIFYIGDSQIREKEGVAEK